MDSEDGVAARVDGCSGEGKREGDEGDEGRRDAFLDGFGWLVG